MALFSKPNPEKQISRDLDAARAGREKLSQRLADAHAKAGEYRVMARQLARDAADDDDLDRTEAALRAGQDRITTLTAALGESDTSIAVLEQKLADIADQKLRAESAAKLEAMVHDLEAAGKLFDTAIAAVTRSATTAGTILLDAKGLEHFAALSKEQVPHAISIIGGVLRGRIIGILDGSASPNLPREDAPAPAEQVLPPTTKQLFLMRACKWTDAAGHLRKSCAFFDADLPLETAERALRIGAAVEISDPQRKVHGGKYAPSHPQLHLCLNLDIAENLELTEPAPPPVFQHPNRATYQVRGG